MIKHAKKSIFLIFLVIHDADDINNSLLVQLQRRFLSELVFPQPSVSNLTIRAILKVIHKISSALDPSIGQFAYLLTVKTIPSSAIELIVKLKNEFGVDEVGKSIAHIA